MDEPAPAPRNALRGRGIGSVIGSMIALGWAAYGVMGLFHPARIPLLAVCLGLSLWVAYGGWRLIRQAAALPAALPAEQAASKRVWRLFFLNLVGEVVLLNVAINVLAAHHLEPFFIPAISMVVGLHFLPMAAFFQARSYWAVGGLMMAAGVVTAAAIATSSMPAAVACPAEGLANAVILWTALVLGSVRRAVEARAA